MGAPSLQWQIARSLLPPNLKLTLHTLALIAEPPKFDNIYFSKSTIGAYSSRDARIAAEDMADLVEFGVLVVVRRSRGGSPGRRTSRGEDPKTSTCYQLLYERLQTWTAADTEKLTLERRSRRERGDFGRKSKPRSADQGSRKQPGSADPGSRRRAPRSNPDPRIRGTLIPGSAEPGSPDQTSTYSESSSENTAGAGDHRPVHAVENQLAGPAEPSDRSARSDGPAFRLLAEHGRRLLAGWGSGPIAWSELRAELVRVSRSQGFADDLVERVEPFLEMQHRFHQESRP